MANMVGIQYRGKRVLVTGATGLVGSWLVKALVSKNANVVALVRDDLPAALSPTPGVMEQITRARGDLTSLSDLCRIVAEYSPEIVFHLGAQTQVGVGMNHPLGTFESNVRGTWNLLESLRLYSRGLEAAVVASSDKAYGESSELPYRETHALLGSYPYDASKACTDAIARCYAKAYGMPVAVARCGNIYGGGDQNHERIVPTVIRAALSGKRPVLRSDGTFVRDYIYVKDVVEAYLSLALAVSSDPDQRGEAFNFGYDRPVTVLELVNIILDLAGRQDLVPDVRSTARTEIRNQYLTSEKARRVLGWQPQYGLEDGLKETIAWYALHMERGQN